MKRPFRAKPGRGRPQIQADAAAKRDLLLDAAEALFSVHGFYGVTTREVAAEAGVDSKLLTYYFGTKRSLFDEVLLRRAEVMNASRLLAMAQYEAVNQPITAEGALQAFFEPVLRSWETGGTGWKNYLRLVAQVNSTPAWGGETITRFFDPVILKLIELLRKALPQVCDEDLFWCYQFVSGALMLSVAETGRIDRLSSGLCHSNDVGAVRQRLAAYSAAGFEELLRRSRAA